MWDWQRYMGGAGSIYRWARETPALAAPDLIHLTPPGYRRTAAALAQSIGWLTPNRSSDAVARSDHPQQPLDRPQDDADDARDRLA